MEGGRWEEGGRRRWEERGGRREEGGERREEGGKRREEESGWIPFFLINFNSSGKYFRMSVLLSKETVSARLKTDEGISFAEFSYQILQGYDFFHLNQQMDCVMQVGGSDQWGNITNGCDLIKKVRIGFGE